MPRADKATFIQEMLSEHELRQQREQRKPEPDSKDWWREVAQGLAVKAYDAEARATTAEQARDALREALVKVRPWLVCDATCVECEEDEPCSTLDALNVIDAALQSVPAPGVGKGEG